MFNIDRSGVLDKQFKYTPISQDNHTHSISMTVPMPIPQTESWFLSIWLLPNQRKTEMNMEVSEQISQITNQEP